jgi:CHAD domain-containing protein
LRGSKVDEIGERLIRVSAAGIRREHGEQGPGEAAPVKGNYRVVEKWMTPPDAFRALCAAGVQHLEANRVGALAGDDPEYLHQIRVALRRLRTAFGLFADAVPDAAGLDGELRWLSRALGRARDWDVFVAGTLKPAVSERPRDAGLRALRDASEELGAEARSAAHRALESRRYYGLMRALRTLSYGETPRPGGAVRSLPMRHAVALIGAMYGRARKRGRKLRRVGSKDFHRLRKAVRRLRYGLLFLAPLLPEARVRALAQPVESLQDTLGGMNDSAVAAKLVGEARRRVRGPRLRKARKVLAKRIAAARAARREALEAQWEGFLAAERSWATAGG